jgi:hypothetical protein
LAAERLKVAQRRRARWAGSKRDGSQHLKIFALLQIYPAGGSIVFAGAD